MRSKILDLIGSPGMRVGLLLVASVLLLGGAVALGSGWVSPAQAQDPDGTIDNLSLSSPDSGQMVISWDQPALKPTDYRVAWAPSDQDYLSYAEANTSDRGNAYPDADPDTDADPNTGIDRNTNTLTLTVNDLVPGAEYKVRVRARYYDGDNEDSPWSGPWSAEATVTISSPPQPTPESASDVVSGLALSGDVVGQLVITWNQPSDEPTDYRVAWAPVDEQFLSHAEDNTSRRGNSYPDGDVTTLTLTGLPGGVEYKVMMRARYHDDQTDQDSSGPWTGEATQRIRNNPPAAPTGLNASEVSHNRVTLSWTAPDHSSITGYRVLRGADADSLTVIVDDAGAIDTEHSDTGVEAETSYVYAVIALSPDGASPQSVTVSATTPAPPDDTGTQQRSETTPGAPAGLLALATSEQVSLEWDDPGDDSITGYQVWRGPNPSGLQVLVADTGSADNRYVDDTVATETTYHYAINAINGAGTGQRSGTASTTTPAPPQFIPPEGETDPLVPQQQNSPPAKPTGLRATDLLERGRVAILLEWDAPSDDVEDYVIYRGTGSQGDLDQLFGSPYDYIGSGRATRLRDNSVDFDTTYRYAIYAESRDLFSPASDTATATTWPRGTPPVAPFDLVAEATDERVTLTWLRDPSNFIVRGYQILRRHNWDQEFDLLEDFVPAAHPYQNSGQGRETYVDTAVKASSNYHYRVKSVNEFGMGHGHDVWTAGTASEVPPNLWTTASHDRVTIMWDDPEDATIAGYRILRRTNWGPESVLVNNTGTTGLSYVDRRVAPDTGYSYRLRAIRHGETGVPSGNVFALTPPLSSTPAAASNSVSEPVGQDLAAGPDTVGRLEVGDTVSGSIATAADRDWFATDLEAGKTYLISPVYEGDNADADGSLYFKLTRYWYPGGQSDYGSGSDSRFWFDAKRGGRHYFEVRGTNGATGDYTLEMHEDPHAAPVGTAEVERWTSGYFHDFDRDDIYRVQLCAGHRYRVPVFSNFAPDDDGNVRTARAIISRTVGQATDDAGYLDPVIYQAPHTGMYEVWVDSRWPDSRSPEIDQVLRWSKPPYNYGRGTYRFLVEDLDGKADPADFPPVSEPSDGDLPAGRATTGVLPTGRSVTGNIASAGDRDWFELKFDHRQCEPRVYWLEMKGADTNDGTLADPYIAGIFDAHGNLIPWGYYPGQATTTDNDSGIGKNAIQDFTPPEPGTYYVEVAGSAGATGSYAVSLRDITDTSQSEVGDIDFAQWEAEEFFDWLVGSLTPGQPATVAADRSLADGERSDIMRLNVKYGRNYRVEVTASEGEGMVPDPFIELFPLLYADHGTYLGAFLRTTNSPPADTNQSFEFKATPKIVVGYEANISEVVWHMYIDFFTARQDSFRHTLLLIDITDLEPDSELAADQTTGTVAVGGRVVGTLNVVGDVDWFRVRLEAGKRYRVRMRGSESEAGTLADPLLKVWQQSDGVRGRTSDTVSVPMSIAAKNDDKSDTEKDSELTFRAGTSGDYYVEANTPGTGTGTYTIEVAVVDN